QLALDIAHTVLGEPSSTPSSTASSVLIGTTASYINPARLSSRNGYHAVNATRLMLIGQPATVSAIKYCSSGRLARSHSRTTARKAWPHSQAAETIRNARRKVGETRTLAGIGYNRCANSASRGRPS